MATIVAYRRRGEAEPDPALSDETLVRAIAGGDRAALGALYDRYHRDVYAFLCSAVAVYGADLDDLVQDTFLAVAGSARRFRGKAHVRTWLFGIAINLGRNYVRAESRRRSALDRMPVSKPAVPRPDECAQSSEQLSRLAAAIAALPQPLREAYVTSVIEGLSSEDAARVLRVRKGTLWRRVHEARAELARRIGRTEES